jgi:hypothetical protein
MDKFSMVFTLQDIALILGHVVTIIGVYVALSSRVVKLESKQEVVENKVSYSEGMLAKDRDRFEVERSNIWKKLADIEAGQGRTNVFLEENLRTLTAIVSRQELRVERIEESVRQLQIDTKT